MLNLNNEPTEPLQPLPPLPPSLGNKVDQYIREVSPANLPTVVDLLLRKRIGFRVNYPQQNDSTAPAQVMVTIFDDRMLHLIIEAAETF